VIRILVNVSMDYVKTYSTLMPLTYACCMASVASLLGLCIYVSVKLEYLYVSVKLENERIFLTYACSIRLSLEIAPRVDPAN